MIRSAIPFPALVLSAGLGTRLRPLTWLRAKPAVPVAGQPLVTRILRWLEAAGVREVLLNLHHLPETITRIVGDGRALGLHVRYSWEQPILGSAGGLRRAFALVDSDTLLVVNGDTLTDVDLAALAREHQEHGALVTMAVIPNPAPELYGGVQVDQTGAVTGFTPRTSVQNGGHFVGAQIVSRAAVERLMDGVPAESVGALYPSLIRERPGAVRAFRTSGSFLDIGTPVTYLESSLACARDAVQLTGAGCRVASDAAIHRSVLWDDVTVEPGASLSGCIVTDGVVVRRGARYDAAVLLRPSDVPHTTDMLADGIVVVPLTPGKGAGRGERREP